MIKRFLSMVLILAMVLSLMPAVVLAEGTEVVKSPKAGTHTDAGHSDDCGATSGWQAWTSSNSLPTSGQYYLTQDVTISGEYVTTADLTLCLNGYVIKQTAEKRIIGTAKNNVKNTLTICDCTAYEEDGVYYAGAFTGGKMVIQDGGGAIFVRREGTLKIYDGRFIDNIYQHDETGTCGGVIMLQGVSSGKFATAYIYGGEFANNKSLKKDGTTANNGGVVGSGGSAVLEISGGDFHHNQGYYGGVIRMHENGKLTITGGTFHDNTGTYGGVAQFLTGSTVVISGGEFTNNSSADGGVIYGASSTVTITNATFTGNRATSSGSVLHNNGNMKLTIGEGTVITGNTGTNKNATEGYSAAVSMCGSNGKLTLTGKVIIANNTTGATGVASLNFNKTASDTLYLNQLAEGSCVEFSTPKTVPTVAGDVVALAAGGAQTGWQNSWLAHMGTDGKLQYVTYDAGQFGFTDAVHLHTLCADAGCTDHTDKVLYQPWTATDSLPTEGNWYLTQNVTVSAEVQMREAKTLNLCLNGKTVTGGTGKGLRAYSTTTDVASTINISDCTAQTISGEYKAGKFTGFVNTHTGSGGAAIFIRKGSTLNFFDGIITGNTTYTGGTVYIKNAVFNMWNGEITDNTPINGTTKKYGGGVYLDNADMTIYDGKIAGNVAEQGGGIYMANGSLTMKGGQITDNEANWGGAVALANGNSACTLDLQSGQITGNRAASNGGALQAAYGSAVVKLSGDIRITGNTLTSGAANNIRLGGSGYVTVGELDSNALIGITATAGRVFSRVVSSDVSDHFTSDDATQVVFMNTDNKLQLKENTAPTPPPVVEEHKHTLCNDTGCTEHTGEVVYQAWTDGTKLPTEGNWYLATDVVLAAETNLKTEVTVNLCLNGHKITGNKGSNIRAYSTTNNVASTINISDCTGNGKIHNFCSTSTGSGGGAIFVRPGSTLRVFDVTFENNVSYCIGGAIVTTGKTYIYDCNFVGNQAYKVADDKTTWLPGGAIYVNVSSPAYGELYVYGATFENNKAIDGGAIYAASNTTTYVEDTLFKGNIATDEGGVYRAAKGNTTFKNVKMEGNQAAVSSAACIYGGTAVLENVEITGGHANGFGALHIGRNDAGATPVSVTLKGKIIVDGNTAGASNNPQNLYMREYECYINATGLTAGSQIGVTYHNTRIASGIMDLTEGQNGTNITGYFASDDAAWVVAMGQEVYLKPAFEHVHCVCGKTDCTDASHEKITYNAWTNGSSLPASGNYCLTTDVTITKEVRATGTLNLCLNGHKVTGGNGKGVRFYSTNAGEATVINIADCTAKTENGVYTAGGFYDNINTHTDSGGGAIFIRKGGTLNFYDGIVSGNVTASGGAAFYIKEATATIYGGLLENNEAVYDGTNYYGGGIYLDNATLILLGGTIRNNKAGLGGGIQCAGSSVVDIRGGRIENNVAATNGGGIRAVSANVDVKLSGEPVIMGNTLADGKASNLQLEGTGMIDVENLGKNALIGVTATAFRVISTETQDYAANFVSDKTNLEVVYQDKVLFMDASGNHKHCLCGGTLSTGCDHSQLTFVEWDDPTSLPTAGNYCLTVDVVVSAQHRLENATLNLCLNGHTIRVGEQGGRVFYMTNGATLNITDCEGNGKLSGATLGAVLTNSAGTDMEINLYAGTFTDNHSNGAGGAIVVQGDCTFNMYGGKLTGNSVTSYLITDAEGKVELDADGNQRRYAANGGALYVANGVFNMYGGEISGNEAKPVGYLKAGATTETITGGVGGGVQITNGATANLYGGKICGNVADNGGGIFVTGTNSVLNIIGGEISGNKARNGGGVISQTHAVSYMTGGIVTGNIATVSGAGIYVSTGTTFYLQGGEVCKNKAVDGKTDKNGGGFYVLSSTLDITGGKIWGNQGASGAGIYSSATTSSSTPRAATIYIKDGALITENKASGNGGAIMMAGLGAMTSGEGSKIIMTGGEISKNSAKNAGGIIIQTKSAFEMSGGKITGNKASDGGGGIYISTGTLFTMTGGSITSNTSANDGGGIYLLRSTAVIKGGSVSYNTGRHAGGIKVQGAKLTVYNLNVVGNKAVGKTTNGKYAAGNAGGLWVGRAGYKKDGVQLYDTPQVYIHNIYLADSTATAAAGGILVQSQDTIFQMYGGTVSGNATPDSSGGGLYLSNNVKANISGVTFTGNKAKNSGAIHIANNNAQLSNLKIYGNEVSSAAGAITITGKTTTEATLKNCEIYNNTAGGHVGALVSQGYANMLVEDCKIYGNKCAGTGGAVYFSNPGYGTLRNVEIYENEAGSQGGAIFLGGHSVAILENVTIRDNVAGTDGGAIQNRGRIELHDCKVLNNTATSGNGGGIGTFKTSSLLLGDSVGVYAYNTVLTGNKAGLQGGAVFGHRACPVYLNDCVITENEAALEGGAIYSDGRMGLKNVTATGNKSGGEGFAIYTTPSKFDGHSYQTGHKRIGGEMIVKDNIGGDLYLNEGTALAVTGEALGEKSYVNVTIFSGVLTQWVFGVYNYEGSNQVYVMTAGDRSITDPEPFELEQETEPVPEETQADTQATETTQGEQDAAEGDDNTMLYVAIGGVAAVLILVAVLTVVIKKKKSGSKVKE